MIIEGTHLEHWIDSITLEHMLGSGDGSIATAETPPKEKKRRSKKKKKTTTTTTTTNKKDSTM